MADSRHSVQKLAVRSIVPCKGDAGINTNGRVSNQSLELEEHATYFESQPMAGNRRLSFQSSRYITLHSYADISC